MAHSHSSLTYEDEYTHINRLGGRCNSLCAHALSACLDGADRRTDGRRDSSAHRRSKRADTGARQRNRTVRERARCRRLQEANAPKRAFQAEPLAQEERRFYSGVEKKDKLDAIADTTARAGDSGQTGLYRNGRGGARGIIPPDERGGGFVARAADTGVRRPRGNLAGAGFTSIPPGGRHRPNAKAFAGETIALGSEVEDRSQARRAARPAESPFGRAGYAQRYQESAERAPRTDQIAGIDVPENTRGKNSGKGGLRSGAQRPQGAVSPKCGPVPNTRRAQGSVPLAARQVPHHANLRPVLLCA